MIRHHEVFSAPAPSGGISEASRASARADERSGRKGENQLSGRTITSHYVPGHDA